MKKFDFRLQKLLDLRIEKEEQSKLQFKKALDEKECIDNKLSRLTKNYYRYSNVPIKGSIIENKMRQNYLNALNDSINQTSQELENQIQILEDRRKKLTQKQIEKKTVEILKDKKIKEFIRQEQYIEQKNNDEFALYGFIRNLKKEVRK